SPSRPWRRRSPAPAGRWRWSTWASAPRKGWRWGSPWSTTSRRPRSSPPATNDHPGLGAARSRPIRTRIAANNARGTATSANWNVTDLAWDTTLAPILISFSRSVVSVHVRTGRGSARCRWKFPRLYAAGSSHRGPRHAPPADCLDPAGGPTRLAPPIEAPSPSRLRDGGRDAPVGRAVRGRRPDPSGLGQGRHQRGRDHG